MEKSLKEIIKEVGKEYEMEEEIINEIVSKLHKQFYIKLKHMKNLSLEIWKSLDLPINLYYVLNELYQSSLSNSKNIEKILPSETIKIPEKQNINSQKQEILIIPSTQPVLKLLPQKNQINNETNIMNQIIKQNNLNEIYGNNSIQSIVHNDLCVLLTEINDIDISKKLFKSIHKIITNISHNPSIERYKKFNIIKLLSSFRYKNIIPFFSHIGFKNIDDYMILQEDKKIINNILIVNTLLNQFIKDNKLAEINFNPYKGSISSLNDNPDQIKKVVENEINFEDLYNKEIERRNDIIKKAKIERKPKYFELEKNYSINKIINTINQKEEDLTSNSNEDKIIIKRNLALLKEKENDRFTIKSRLKLEKLMKTPIYVKSDIRLKFPNEQILQGSFSLYETIGDIYNFIKIYLKDDKDKFNISTTPPLKRYVKMETTIGLEKLYPNLLMYVNFERDFHGLNEEKIKLIKEKFELMDNDEEETTNSVFKDDDNNNDLNQLENEINKLNEDKDKNKLENKNI